jgi:hypothetical protein
MLDLLRIPQVHISKFGPETGYPNVFVVFLSPPSTCGAGISNYTTASTFRIFSISLPPYVRIIMNSKIKEIKTNPAVLEKCHVTKANQKLLQTCGFATDREERTCCFMTGPEEIAVLVENNSDDVLITRGFW